MMRIFLLTILLLITYTLSAQSGFGATEEADYRGFLSKLASDTFLGRKPFTKGEEMTVSYLEKEFKSIGLMAGNGESFFQDVPMAEIKGKLRNDEITVSGKNGVLRLAALTDIVAGTRRIVKEQKLTEVPLVFAGFGIDAPEYNWNDYAGLDVNGKIVVVMINDPGFYNPELFRGRDVTYYGRWTYKFEEAARKGAAGVVIIHDSQPAAYGWSVVRSSWSKSKLFLQSPDGNKGFCALEGWISGDAAKRLFDLSGRDEAAMLNSAKNPGFKGTPLGITLSATIINEIKNANSKNVIALLPGTSRRNEYIIFSAHWDHFGVGESIDGDSIYNGAADNATGVAALLTLAKKFKANPPNERSLIFFAPTAEEAGLLGSQYYATHPVYPLKQTVVDINFDVLQPFGRMSDIFIIGKGQSTVDHYLEDAAKKEGRTVRAVPDPSNGWYYRSDHFSFAKVGVPTLYTANGVQSVEHGEAWGKAQNADYNANRYHKPQDNYDPSWDVSGTMEDLKLIYEVGRKLANSSDYPVWHEGLMYKKIRALHK